MCRGTYAISIFQIANVSDLNAHNVPITFLHNTHTIIVIIAVRSAAEQNMPARAISTVFLFFFLLNLFTAYIIMITVRRV